MRTRTPTTADQITAEKMKISERLARLDADRERIATQLADLEAAERVLTRVSKAPPVRRAPNRKFYVWGSGEAICLPNGNLRYFETEREAWGFLATWGA